jgi:hypothetical protein
VPTLEITFCDTINGGQTLTYIRSSIVGFRKSS